MIIDTARIAGDAKLLHFFMIVMIGDSLTESRSAVYVANNFLMTEQRAESHLARLQADGLLFRRPHACPEDGSSCYSLTSDGHALLKGVAVA